MLLSFHPPPTNQGRSRDAHSLRHNPPRGLQRPAFDGDGGRYSVLIFRYQKSFFNCTSAGSAIGQPKDRTALLFAFTSSEKGRVSKRCLIISGALETVAKSQATDSDCTHADDCPALRIHDLGFCPWPPPLHANLESTINLTLVPILAADNPGGRKQPDILSKLERCQKSIVQEPLLCW